MSGLTGVIVSLAVGVVASLLWLLVLFAVKPRLEVEVKGRRAGGKPTPGWAFVVTNKSLVSAVQVRARLWRVSLPKGGFATRQPVALKNDELFRLNGSWAGGQTIRQRKDRTGDNRFRFLTDPDSLPLEDCLGDTDYLLFQVWAQHGFTNFGRVTTKIIERAALTEILRRG